MSDAANPAARSLVLDTPEHVPVGFVLADLGNRLAALVVDLLIVGLGLAVLVLAGLIFFEDDDPLTALFLLAAFLWRNFYFTAGEIYGRGRTPGKRWLRTRVVARDGGPLSAEQVFARNLTRDLEIFLPLTVLLAPKELVPGAPWWVGVAAVVWVLALALLPFFNQHRARLGDLLAGTIVVVEPVGELLPDLAAADAAARGPAVSREQLDVYGIRELHVLEKVLRRAPSLDKSALLRTICEKVRAKIGWKPPVENAETFLQAFYAAQRGRLEHNMLFGKRQERKVR
jgi:uncharacterized RDD family membrane protein YckC